MVLDQLTHQQLLRRRLKLARRLDGLRQLRVQPEEIGNDLPLAEFLIDNALIATEHRINHPLHRYAGGPNA